MANNTRHLTANTRRLVESAILIALGTLMSEFKYPMPLGGGLTFCSMLPLILLSHRYGWKWGLFSSTAYSLLQLVLGLDNMQSVAVLENLPFATKFFMLLGIVFLDYIIAYTVIGFSGFFDTVIKDRRKALATGIAVTFFLRFLCHLVTGIWIWDALWPNEQGWSSFVYSLAYNGWYMAGELILTEIVAMLLYVPMGRYFRGEDLPKK